MKHLKRTAGIVTAVMALALAAVPAQAAGNCVAAGGNQGGNCFINGSNIMSGSFGNGNCLTGNACFTENGCITGDNCFNGTNCNGSSFTANSSVLNLGNNCLDFSNCGLSNSELVNLLTQNGCKIFQVIR